MTRIINIISLTCIETYSSCFMKKQIHKFSFLLTEPDLGCCNRTTGPSQQLFFNTEAFILGLNGHELDLSHT